MKKLFYIGIDPGAQGAVAVIDEERNILLLEDLPQEKTRSANGTMHSTLDCAATGAMLFRYSTGHAALERPVPFGPNAFASFHLGICYGSLLGIMSTLGVRTLTVRSGTWKKSMGLSADKKLSVTRAKELFTGLPKRLRADKAEALLLAYYRMNHRDI